MSEMSLLLGAASQYVLFALVNCFFFFLNFLRSLLAVEESIEVSESEASAVVPMMNTLSSWVVCFFQDVLVE